MVYERWLMKLLSDIAARNHFPFIGNAELIPTRLEQWRERVEKHHPELLPEMEALLAQKTGKQMIDCLFSHSPYLTQCIFKEMPFFMHLCAAGTEATITPFFYDLNSQFSLIHSQEELMVQLRRFKLRCSLLVALADIFDLWELEKITGTLSRFAEAAVSGTVDFLLKKATERQELSSALAEESGLIVLAMGKLGARALNYSSDIDLILFFDPEKTTYTGQRTTQIFFNRFAQDLTKILEERTADGYVFRVDLRLRPDPASTPAAVSIPAAERYYETVGQNWERAALIKARPIAGDFGAAVSFLKWLSPFIWRKYLDYASIQDIHSIKRQIESKTGAIPENLLGFNVKLGHGGIREVEFFAVTQQLIWGGKQTKLRSIRTIETLRNLTEAGKVPQTTCDELIEAYRFYRTVEHRLQMVEDHQTHSLPDTPEQFAQFARFMGYEDAEHFERALSDRLKLVQRHYAQLFRGAPSLANPIAGGSLVFTGTNNDPETVKTIARMGFKNAEDISEMIRGWHHGRRAATRTKRARELITEITPALLAAFSQTAYSDQAFSRFDEFLGKIPSSIQIFALFYAKPELLDIFAEIMGGYPYLADSLSRKPELIDYLLSTDFYLALPQKEILIDQLEASIGDTNSIEDILNIIRRFAHDRQFRVGVQLIQNKIDPDEASIGLSNIARAVLEVLQKHVLREFKEKHGAFTEMNFTVLAFGKLGSRELTFGSDLDLVFVYEAEGEGNSDLSVSDYFARVARRMITGLTAMTAEGTLYDIDTRLRPSGKDGPVASSFESFAQYYKNTAWTWEFMALTRARALTGSNAFKLKIKNITRELLSQPRDQKKLANDIREMREKIAKEYPSTLPFDIKYVRGGLIDVEFIAQYLQLAYGATHPKIFKRSAENVFAACKPLNLIPEHIVQDCIVACEMYRNLQFYSRVIGITNLPDEEMNANMKSTLVNLLNQNRTPLSFEEIKNSLVSLQHTITSHFDGIIQ